MEVIEGQIPYRSSSAGGRTRFRKGNPPRCRFSWPCRPCDAMVDGSL